MEQTKTDSEKKHLKFKAILISIKFTTTPTLKNVTNTCPVDPPSKTRAKKVVNPPLKTAGPISTIAEVTLDDLEPENRSQLIVT